MSLVRTTRRLEQIASFLLFRDDRTFANERLSIVVDRNLSLPLARSLSRGEKMKLFEWR